MIAVFCRMGAMLLAVSLLGCASESNQIAKPPDPRQEGWTRLGKIVVTEDMSQDILKADHLPGIYRSLRFDTNGPAQIERVAMTFANARVILPDQGLTFDKAGSQVIELPGDERVELVMLVHSGGRLILNTTVTVWVK